MKYLLNISLLLFIIGCGSKPVERPVLNKKKKNVSTKLPKDVSEFSIAVVPGLPVIDPNTKIPNTKIYIYSPDFPELIYLVNDFNCEPMNPEEIRRLKIPMNANFLFKSTYGGGGTNYYGLFKDGGVELYGQAFDKGSPIAAPDAKPFNQIRKFDLKNRAPLDGFFICFVGNQGEQNQMSIYYDVQGMANSIKFDSDDRWIPLQYNTSQVVDEGAMQATIDQYFVIDKGVKSAILNLTQSGEWVYASYTDTEKGVKQSFTIDQKKTMVQGEYRKDACF